MLKEKIKGVLVGVLIGSTLTGGLAFGKTATEVINASYQNIKIYVEGKLIDPRDAKGNVVEPFIYNGTTYLPVRAVGEAFGKNVSWDGNSKTVYVGQKPGEILSWVDVCRPYDYRRGKEYLLSSNKFFTMSGNEYSNGFTLQADPFGNQTSYALFNLNGQYNSLSFKVGHVDNTGTYSEVKLKIYLDEKLVQTENLKSDTPIKTVNVNLNGALHMKIETETVTSALGATYYGFAEGIFK